MILRDLHHVEKRDRIAWEIYLPIIKGSYWREPDNPPPSGERALILSIIGQAYLDALALDEDALAYFESDAYQDHLAWLGLPFNWLPEGLYRLDWDELIAMNQQGEKSHV